MATQLRSEPAYVTARSVAGALAADPVVISDANYPVANAVVPHGHWPTITGNWYASGGTVLPTDWVDIQLLFRDNRSQWIEGPVASGIKQNQEFTLPVYDNTSVFIRVKRVSCAGGTGLVVRAASSRHPA